MKAIAMFAIALMLVASFAGCVSGTPKDKTPIGASQASNPDAPLASFEYKMTEDGLVVDASKSADQKGLALRYTWFWGDGTNTTGLKTLHSYEGDGVYNVQLMADNGKGDVGIANLTIDTTKSENNGTCDSDWGIEVNATQKANKWAIVEGDNYPGTGNELPDCHLDALNVYDYLVKNCGFPVEQTFLFLNQSDCPKNIKAAISFIANNSNESSEFVYYHSGHGPTVTPAGDDLVDAGICLSTDSWNDIYTVWVGELKQWFSPIKSQKFAFISDSCMAGELSGIGPGQFGVSLTEGLSAPGRIIIGASCEATLSSSTGEGGAFTVPFVSWGLREGKADGCSMIEPSALAGTVNTKDGKVSIQEAYWYTWWAMNTGQGFGGPADVEQQPDMSDNYGEPFYL
ncbi:MAG: PKD domain-containing protein [Candidatus Thermoplasmatota archaeon]|nr:PKD domain-containing protein [Candidatus Thermoplasmatota archaeon]